MSLYTSIPDMTTVLGKRGFKSIETSSYYWAGSVKPGNYIDAAEGKLCPELSVLPNGVTRQGIERHRGHLTRRGDKPFRDGDASTLIVGKKECVNLLEDVFINPHAGCGEGRLRSA